MSTRQLSRNALQRQVRRHGFASPGYHSCFGNIPASPDKAPYKEAVLKAFESVDKVRELWVSDPVKTVINGRVVSGKSDVTADTVDAFKVVNGKIVLGDASVLAQLKAHVSSLNSDLPSLKKDYRKEIRAIEDLLCTPEFAAQLIVNQSIDFHKQDGYTEIEEWIQAGTVERRLTDLLLADEDAGKLTIGREPAFIGCVSNFSNFLDLSRKVLRNLEVGVPVVVMSRGNTTQHMYRWFTILSDQIKTHLGEDALRLVTYASLDVPSQRELLLHSKNSPMYFTGSREVAEKLKEVCPNLMAATSGPNTLVNTSVNDNIINAIRLSSVIEHAGQCTHVRHVVAPKISAEHIEKVYTGVRQLPNGGVDAVHNDFKSDGLFPFAPKSNEPGYTHAEGGSYVIRSQLPPDNLDEKWREPYLDVTSLDSESELHSEEFVDQLSQWLVRNGPISTGINGSKELALRVFEKTSMTVYNVGTLDAPGLTVSARPQEGEAFGEFPARPTLFRYTKFPVLVPSSTPSYHSQYTETYLKSQASKAPEGFRASNGVSELASGYVATVAEFLKESSTPSSNTSHRHARTAVAGWQRPPLSESKSVIRAEAETSVDAVAVNIAPFLLTNAKDNLVVSVDPTNEKVVAYLKTVSVPKTLVQSADEFKKTKWEASPYNVQVPAYDGNPATGGAPLASCFVVLHFPVGHIKSLNKNDDEFVKFVTASDKWLKFTSA